MQPWSPYLAKGIDNLEKAQRRATKLVPNIAKLTYHDRLRYLGLYSLYGRHQRGDLIETYKILNGWDHVEAGHFFQESSQLGRTRGHAKKIFKQRARLQIRRRFFSLRVIDQWNGLPQAVVNVKTVSKFKARLDRYWSSLGYGYQQRPTA